jgi:hypothetical protein
MHTYARRVFNNEWFQLLIEVAPTRASQSCFTQEEEEEAL